MTNRVYSYKYVPTLKKFSMANQFLRAAMGPFGCLSNDSEYLTSNGWKIIEDYTEGDLVAQYDPTNQSISFASPIDYIIQPETHFYRFRGIYLDMMLSGEHRLLLGDGSVMSAQSLAYKYWENRFFKLRFDYEQEPAPFLPSIPTLFKISDRDGMELDDNAIRLMVAVIAEGSFHKEKTTNGCSMGFKKERKKIRIEKLLKECQIKFSSTDYQDGRTYYYFQSPLRLKKFGKPFWASTNNQMKVVLDEITHWDCSQSCQERLEYSTTEKESADFIQYCLTTQGIKANINTRIRGDGARKSLYRITFGEQERRPSVLYATPDAVEYIEYGNGFKYCFKTETGFFVARRNGRIFITGNSGKSSACVIELVKRARLQAPDKDGIRRTKFAVVRNCYDDQTEILTEKRGWQLFKNLETDDKVATLQDGERLEYRSPNKLCEFDYHGEMIGCSMEGLDFLVTPDHNLYVSRINGRDKTRAAYEHREAREVFGKTNVEFKTTSTWEGGNSELSEDVFEFLGLWFAEGSAGVYGERNVRHWSITQKKDKPYVKSVLLKANIGYSVNSRPGGDIFKLDIKKDPYLFELCLNAGLSVNRSIPLSIKNAPSGHLRAFLRGYIRGDGHYKCSLHDSTRVWTSSSELANDIQEISIKAGYVTSIKTRKYIRAGKTALEHVITFFCDKKQHPQPRKNKGKSPWYKQDYDGKVYCVEMPDCIVCVRRSGRHHWGIRSYPQLRDTTVPTFMYWCGHMGEYKSSEYDFRFTNLTAADGSMCECTVHFRPLDKPQDIKNLLSLELTGAWFNEVREIPKAIVDAMRGRVGRYPSRNEDGTGGATWSGIWMDTNPPDSDHWFYSLFEESKPQTCVKCRNPRGGFIYMINNKCPMCGGTSGYPMTAIFKQPSGFSKEAENLPYLPPNYYENLAAGMDPEFIKVYVEGKYGFVREGRPVYSTWDDLKHLAKDRLKAIPGIPLLVGFDNTGLNQACVLCQYMPWGQLRVLHEFLVREMGTRRFARQVVKPFIMSNYPGIELIVTGDPAGVRRSDTDERNTFQELDEAGLPAFPASSNAWQARFNAVETFLMRYLGKKEGNDAYGLLVSPECKMIHKGFLGGYRMRRLQVVGQERYTDRPEKNEIANLHDSLQYAAMAAESGIRDQVQAKLNIVDSPDATFRMASGWDAYV